MINIKKETTPHIKIKGVDCRISYQKEEENKQEIFCHGDAKCHHCCGMEDCECNNHAKSPIKK
jgi:hypothetical protein